MYYKIRRGDVSNPFGSTIVHAVSDIALAFMIGTITAVAQAQPPESPKISARIEARATPDCIKAKFFLKNGGTEPIEIVYGRGGMGQDVVPEFHTQFLTITPSVVKQPGRRSMMNDILRIPPGKEVEYGTYTLANPLGPGFGMGNSTNEYLEGRFVYVEGPGIGPPKIDVTSNRTPWSEIDPKRPVERKPGALFPLGNGMSGSPDGPENPK